MTDSFYCAYPCSIECPMSASTAVFNNSIYIFGGITDSFTPLDQLISISPTPGTENLEWVGTHEHQFLEYS